MIIRSIVLLPSPDATQWMIACAQYCAAKRYEIVAIVHTWADVWPYLRDGRATVLVTGRRDHLPHNHEPRLEVVSEQDQSSVVPVALLRTGRRRPATRPANRR